MLLLVRSGKKIINSFVILASVWLVPKHVPIHQQQVITHIFNNHVSKYNLYKKSLGLQSAQSTALQPFYHCSFKFHASVAVFLNITCELNTENSKIYFEKMLTNV